MKTLNLYVTKEFCITLLLSIGVLTFALLGANMLKVFKLLAEGVTVFDAMKFLFNIMPSVLGLGIPWAILVAVMLVFGKMSADNEITAMRACGISIMQIISPIILIVFLLTILCLWLQLEIGPVTKLKARQIGRNVVMSNPMSMFQPGEELPIDNMRVTIGEIDEKGNLKDVQIYVMSKDGSALKDDIQAKRGVLKVDKRKEVIYMTLFDVAIVRYDFETGQPYRWFSTTWTHPIKYGEESNKKNLQKKISFLPIEQLFARAVLDSKRGLPTAPVELELHRRLTLGLSPIAFLLLGLPLAIRTSRRETSLGLLISVALAGLFLALVMIFRSMSQHPEYHPELLIWLPNVVYQVCGIYFIYRIAKR